MGQHISSKKSTGRSDRSGLILYYHPLSYYSQKVLFVLNEKNIPCTLHEVDVTNGEQCSNWFMQMNPKIDIPVLQNDTMIVPSSNQIINYLEANFLGDKHNQLLPLDDRKLRGKILYYHRKISQIPVGVLSFGTILHSKIVSKPKLPFIGPLRYGFLQSENEMLNKLERLAGENLLHRDALLLKVKLLRDKYETIKSTEKFDRLVENVEHLLSEIEAELERQFLERSEWLCCNRFTLADVSLGMLLHRLSILGLEGYFWGNKKKPFLFAYFRRVTAQKSFQQALPSTKSMMKAVWGKLPCTYKVCAISATAAIFGVVIFKLKSTNKLFT